MDLAPKEVVNLITGDINALEHFRIRAQARRLFTPAISQSAHESVLIVEVTRDCNLRCLHCCFDYGGRQKLALEFFSCLTAQVNLSELVLSGGEPLLHHQIFSLIELSLSRAPKVSLVTNGTVQYPPALRKLADGGATLVISLDGARAETHDRLRGAGVFNLAIGTALQFRALSPNLELSFTCNRRNLHEIPQMFDLAYSLGASKINFRPVYAPVGSKWESLSLDQADFNRAWLELVDLTVAHRRKIQVKNIALMFDNVRFGQRQICGAGKHLFFLQADRRLSPCRYWSKTHSIKLDLATMVKVINGADAFPSRPAPATTDICQACIWRAICAGGCLAQSCAMDDARGYCYHEIYKYILNKILINEVV
ncbi:MAG: radical SAM protein [Bacillota bacterium]